MTELTRNSKFLYGDDFVVHGEWKQFTLTIKGTIEENTLKLANGKMLDQPALRFEETDKVLGINGTNLRLLRLATGTVDKDELIGKRITLYPAAGDAFGNTNIPWVRIRLPDGTPTPAGVVKHLGRDLTGTKLKVNMKPQEESNDTGASDKA